MKSILVRALAALVALLIPFVVLVLRQPGPFRVIRSASIAAPPAVVFGQVNDFHKWAEWSPWAKLDPAMKLTIDGPAAGKGSIYWWSGNSEVGEGRMTIVDSKPGEHVEILLEFIKPWTAVNQTVFQLRPEGGGTVVTWSMTGTNDFFGKAFCLFSDMDRLVGGDFEKGLAQLKVVSEKVK